MDSLRETHRLLTSKATQRAILNAVLLAFGAATLLGLATVASGVFFHSFVPRQVITKPVYLQYGSGPNPYALVSLTSPVLKPAQEYDVSVSLSMPRSQANLDRGNFMISLHFLDADLSTPLEQAARRFAEDHDHFDGHSILFSSRRPALTPYEDPLVSLASRILFIFYYMLFPASQKHELKVGLAEQVLFAKGTSIPGSAYIEIEAGQNLQTYQASLTLTAQLRGLRWLMFHYRLPMYIFFTLLFWACEVVFMAGAWSFWSSQSSQSSTSLEYLEIENRKAGSASEKPRNEGGDSSDRPLSFKADPGIKEEDDPEREESRQTRLLSELPMAGADADDEYEEDDGRATGTGNSFNQQDRDGLGIRRRASRGP